MLFRSVLSKQFVNAPIAGIDIAHREITAPDTRLICYTYQPVTSRSEKRQSLGGPHFKLYLQGATQIIRVDNNRAVAIKENCLCQLQLSFFTPRRRMTWAKTH